MDEKPKVKDTGCCKPFNPKPWDKKTIVLKDKLMAKIHIINFFHIPINANFMMQKAMDLIEKAKAKAKVPFMMADESLFGSDWLISVGKEVPGLKSVKVSGTFLSKVYEGNYSKMGEWIRDMQGFAKSKNKEIKKLYFFYTMCPACAKAYGQNYTVLLAQV